MRRNFLLPLMGVALLAGVLTSAQTAPAREATLMPLPSLPTPNAFLPAATDSPCGAAETPACLDLHLSQRQVTLFNNGVKVKSYPVAVGKAGWETPTGQFKVEHKYRNPAWKNPFDGSIIPGGDPYNPLGQRWMGFWTDGKNWAGFHGTPNRESIGRAASHGCVRMYGEDIAELFDQVAVGSTVIVRR